MIWTLLSLVLLPALVHSAVRVSSNDPQSQDATGCGVGSAPPCRTITFGVTQAQPPSDTVLLSGRFTDIGVELPFELTIQAAPDAPGPVIWDGQFLGTGLHTNYSLTLRGLTMQHFVSPSAGGAVLFTPLVVGPARLVLENCNFWNNSATAPCGYQVEFSNKVLTGGGAVHAISGWFGWSQTLMSVSVSGCVFADNTALGQGGALLVRYSVTAPVMNATDPFGVNIADSCFARNLAGALQLNASVSPIAWQTACDPRVQTAPYVDLSALTPYSMGSETDGSGGAVAVVYEAITQAFAAPFIGLAMRSTRVVANVACASTGGGVHVAYERTMGEAQHLMQNVTLLGTRLFTPTASERASESEREI
jgi:hypothetical protein